MEITLPKNHVSYSQINMFKRCPRQYYYRYIEDRIIPPKWIMPAGKAGHKAMEYNNNSKMKTGINVKQNEVIEFFANAWKEETASYEKIMYGDMKPGDVVTLMKQPINKYFDDGTFIHDVPIAVEREFALQFEDIDTTVVGTIDVEFEPGIYDYKFSQKSPSINTIANSDQLKMYAVSKMVETKQLPKKLGFTYLISTKAPQVKIYEIPHIKTFINNFMQDLKESLETISLCLSSGVFIRNSTGFMCNPKDCGYWDICKPGQKKIYFDLETAYSTKKG